MPEIPVTVIYDTSIGDQRTMIRVPVGSVSEVQTACFGGCGLLVAGLCYGIRKKSNKIRAAASAQSIIANGNCHIAIEKLDIIAD